MFHPRPLGRRNKRILKNKKTVTTMMIMKMKMIDQPIVVLFTPKQLEVLLKMNRPDFTKLVEALKGRSSKSVGFKPVKPRNFDGVQN
jgi:hypothetical protein